VLALVQEEDTMRLWLSDRARQQMSEKPEKAKADSAPPDEAEVARRADREKKLAEQEALRASAKAAKDAAHASDMALNAATELFSTAQMDLRDARSDDRQRKITVATTNVADQRQAIIELREKLVAAEARLVTLHETLDRERALSQVHIYEARQAEAMKTGQAAYAACNAAWTNVPRAYMKTERDRSIKRSARAIGLGGDDTTDE